MLLWYIPTVFFEHALCPASRSASCDGFWNRLFILSMFPSEAPKGFNGNTVPDVKTINSYSELFVRKQLCFLFFVAFSFSIGGRGRGGVRRQESSHAGHKTTCARAALCHGCYRSLSSTIEYNRINT